MDCEVHVGCVCLHVCVHVCTCVCIVFGVCVSKRERERERERERAEREIVCAFNIWVGVVIIKSYCTYTCKFYTILIYKKV